MTRSGNDDAERALSFEGNLVIDAGPGTGKTHLIAAKAARFMTAASCRPDDAAMRHTRGMRETIDSEAEGFAS